MFSERTEWHTRPNKISLLLEGLRARNGDIWDLTATNPTDAGLHYPADGILAALRGGEALRYDPQPLGLLTAREAVAAYYHAKQVNVSTSEIVLTASTSEAYAYALMLLCNAGDAVLVPTPSYPLCEYLAQLSNVHTQTYRLRYDGEWHVDLDSVQRSLTSSTRAILLVSPHNPTGMFLKRSEHEALVAIATEHNLALIVDEVFSDYGFAHDERRVTTSACSSDVLTFTLNGISKLCGLPQMKLGWMVVSGGEEPRREALQRLEIIADTFLSVNTPVQVGLPKLMHCGETTRTGIRERVQMNLQVLRESIARHSPVTVLHCEGGWQAILKVPNTKSEEEWVLTLLENAGVYVYPGYYFEFQEQGYLVLSLLAQPESFTRGVQAIVNIICG